MTLYDEYVKAHFTSRFMVAVVEVVQSKKYNLSNDDLKSARLARDKAVTFMKEVQDILWPNRIWQTIFEMTKT